MVVMEPETAMAVIPGKGEIAWADEFSRFSHGWILPGGTDKLALERRCQSEYPQKYHHRSAQFPHKD